VVIIFPSRRLEGEWVALLAGMAAVAAGLAVDLAAWLSVRESDLTPVTETADVTLDQARAIINSLFAVLVGVSMFCGSIWLLLLWRVYRRRRRGARITATLLAVIWMLVEIPSVTGHTPGGGLTAIPAAVTEIALVVTLACLHAPTGRAVQRWLRPASPVPTRADLRPTPATEHRFRRHRRSSHSAMPSTLPTFLDE
jgi:hypothetical protein